MGEQAKLLDELTKKTLKTIKTEPMSDEEQNVPNESASEMRKRKLSNPIAAESWKMNRASISDPPQRQPTSAVSSRDPRLAKKTFLDGGLTTDDLIRSSDPVPESSLTTFQKSVLRKVQDIKQPNAFSANIPRAPRIPDKLDQQRSPAIISSHNPLFASQTTKENVRDSTNSQRYRNIPSKDRDSGTKSGDSDRISRAIQAPKEVQNSKTQRQEFTRAEHKTFEDKNVQTTKNTGGFSIIIDDLNSLTPEQRKALVEFKNVMNCNDESSTDAILERSAHRRADRARKQSMERSYTKRNGSQDRSNSYVNQEAYVSRNANPPGPSSSTCRNWTPK